MPKRKAELSPEVQEVEKLNPGSSAYVYYSKQIWEKERKERGDSDEKINFVDVTKRHSEEWKDQSVKDEYEKRYSLQLMKYYWAMAKLREKQSKKPEEAKEAVDEEEETLTEKAEKEEEEEEEKQTKSKDSAKTKKDKKSAITHHPESAPKRAHGNLKKRGKTKEKKNEEEE